MKAPRDEASLRALLRAGGFTPRAVDVDAVIDRLADPDAAVADQAARALARLGEAALPALAKGARDARAVVRAGVYGVAGRVAPMGADAAAWMVLGLDDPDARVRRYAARALGKLRGSEAAGAIVGALSAAWDAGPAPDLKRAIAGSLGKLGDAGASLRLGADEAADPETRRVTEKARMMLARDGAREAESRVDPARALEPPPRVALVCREGLERIVAEEARALPALAGVEPPIDRGGRVFARLAGTLGDLLRLRTATDFAVALAPVAVDGDPDGALARALASPEARRVLDGWTRGIVRFRIAWDDGGHQRARTWRAAQAIARLVPEWVNDPTESTWVVHVRAEGGALDVLLSPRALDDRRFAYRVRDVPAASHPPLAAALVRVAGVRADDVVWDPFVGSGVELVERALAGPFARLVGTDTDPRALDAARANLAAAGAERATLATADATTHDPGGVTLIVTNPPMGRRVARDGSLGALLDRFVDHAADVLAPGGRLVWLSPLGARTSARAAARGLAVTMDSEVDMGGFRARLQRFERRRR